MRSLYQIGADLEALEQLMTDLEGEITDDQIGAAIEAWFDELGDERDEKIRRYCGLIEQMSLAVDMCKEASRRLQRLGRANENGADRLKNRLKQFFEDHKIDKLDLKTFKPRLQANSARKLIYPTSWESEPAGAPERYHKVVVALDSAILREDAEAFEAEFLKLKEALANEAITLGEFEAKARELSENNPVRFAPRGNHIRLR